MKFRTFWAGGAPLDPPLDCNPVVFNAPSLRTTPLCFSASECTTYLRRGGGKSELHFRVKHNSPPDGENSNDLLFEIAVHFIPPPPSPNKFDTEFSI